MSSRVLAGSATKPAQQVVWRKVTPDRRTGRDLTPGHGETPIEELQARLAEMEQQMRRGEEQAYESGLRKGTALGEEQASRRLDPVAERLARTVEELAGQRRRVRREAEEDVVRLALAIGRRILHRELSIDPEALLGVVKAALKKLEGREVDRVRVQPVDLPLVKRHFEQLGRLDRIEVVADSSLERGAVVFETPRGSLDASIETQLQEIQRGLSDRMMRS